MNNIIPTLTEQDIQNKTQRFIKAMQTAKQMETELNDFWKYVQQEMEDRGIASVKGDWGHLTIAERKVWSGTDLPPRFYKQTLNTARLNGMYKLGDTLPKGASFRMSTYLSKRIK